MDIPRTFLRFQSSHAFVGGIVFGLLLCFTAGFFAIMILGTPYSIFLTRSGQKVPLSGSFPLSQIKSVIQPLLQ